MATPILAEPVRPAISLEDFGQLLRIQVDSINELTDTYETATRYALLKM